MQTRNIHHADRPSSEAKDCSVHALANVLDISYTEAHKITTDAGRETRCGWSVNVDKLRQLISGWLWLPATWWHRDGMTLGKFCKTHPRGRFYLHLRRKVGKRLHAHAVAVIDGVVINPAGYGARSYVDLAWELEDIRAYRKCA